MVEVSGDQECSLPSSSYNSDSCFQASVKLLVAGHVWLFSQTSFLFYSLSTWFQSHTGTKWAGEWPVEYLGMYTWLEAGMLRWGGAMRLPPPQVWVKDTSCLYRPWQFNPVMILDPDFTVQGFSNRWDQGKHSLVSRCISIPSPIVKSLYSREMPFFLPLEHNSLHRRLYGGPDEVTSWREQMVSMDCACLEPFLSNRFGRTFSIYFWSYYSFFAND